MTKRSSSNRDIVFTIPKEIRDYYQFEFACVINKQKQFVEIIRSHLYFFNLNIVEFKGRILRPILDNFAEAKHLSPAEKIGLIEFKTKVGDF